jgi:hypothetical protein
VSQSRVCMRASKTRVATWRDARTRPYVGFSQPPKGPPPGCVVWSWFVLVICVVGCWVCVVGRRLRQEHRLAQGHSRSQHPRPAVTQQLEDINGPISPPMRLDPPNACAAFICSSRAPINMRPKGRRRGVRLFLRNGIKTTYGPFSLLRCY